MNRFTVSGIHAVFAILAFVMLAGSDGCETRKYAVVTRIEQDGSFYRSIEQPRDDTLPPEAITRTKSYPPSTQPADYTLRPDWARLWSESQPATEPANDAPGAPIKASGTFSSADRIPRNYHLVAYPLDDHVSDNQIAHNYEDYLLLGIDDWAERITETVALYEYGDTIDEIIHTLLPALEATMDELFHQEYDFTELYALVRSEGAATARRFAFLLYQMCPETRSSLTTQQQLRQLKDILAAVGFQMPLNEKGDEIDNEKAREVARNFFNSLCREHVRLRASAEHLTADQADKFLKLVGLDFAPRSQTQPATATASSDQAQPAGTSNPATEPATQETFSWDKAHEIFCGHFLRLTGREFEPMALLWAAKTGGAHRNGPISLVDPAKQFGGSRQYTYRLETPGEVLETDGQRVGSNAVVWTFGDGDLWPLGWMMHARAIRWNRQAEHKLFGRTVLTDLETAIVVRDAVAKNQGVRDALKQALDQGTLDPLKKLAGQAETDESKAARDILALATRPSP